LATAGAMLFTPLLPPASGGLRLKNLGEAGQVPCQTQGMTPFLLMTVAPFGCDLTS
jgi:hypothetical protein